MKNPNGYGNISKLSGNRRKPWRVRKTTGYLWDADKKKAVQQYINIGYYATRKEAMQALAEYNADPYDIKHNVITFEEVYDKWSDEHFTKISESNIKGYQAAFALCKELKNMKMVEIKLEHLQKAVDTSQKNSPTLKKLKTLWSLMFEYCVRHEILSEEKAKIVRYVDITKAGNPNALNREPFTRSEIGTVWNWKDSNPYVSVVIMLIYSGVRIGELLDLKKEHINLQEKWFDVTASKTEAGIRRVPIADKVYPFFEEWYHKNNSEYLLSMPDGEHFNYRNYYDSYWKPLMAQMDMEHRPHDTRHTCISMLAAAGVDERIIKKIVGHKGQGVTQIVYTHFEIAELLDAINKI